MITETLWIICPFISTTRLFLAWGKDPRWLPVIFYSLMSSLIRSCVTSCRHHPSKLCSAMCCVCQLYTRKNESQLMNSLFYCLLCAIQHSAAASDVCRGWINICEMFRSFIANINGKLKRMCQMKSLNIKFEMFLVFINFLRLPHLTSSLLKRP